MMRQYELVERVQKYKPDANEALLNKAYVYAMQKHGKQTRASGDPYISHPLEVAAILTDMHLDESTIAVALLHLVNNLSLPVTGQTLVYAYLGYDPDWARLSVGTVLQMDALERLFAEARYRWFDFTEGDGAHKEMFGTHAAACSSLVLLEPTLANRALLGARAGFDASVLGAKALAERSGALGRIRALLRA